MDTILIVLLPDFSGELNSTIIGLVYLSFPICCVLDHTIAYVGDVRVMFSEGFSARVDIVTVEILFSWVHCLVIVCRCFRKICDFLL